MKEEVTIFDRVKIKNSKICIHGKLKQYCKLDPNLCGLKENCKHNIKKSDCKDCIGKRIYKLCLQKKKNSVNKVKEVRFVNMIKEDQSVKNV